MQVRAADCVKLARGQYEVQHLTNYNSQHHPDRWFCFPKTLNFALCSSIVLAFGAD